jgi:competence protein ComEC
MQDSPTSFKSLTIAAVGSLAIILGVLWSYRAITRTSIVICDVGQGNAAYIRISGKFDLIVDAGPDRSILQCLGKHMPFYDRDIDLIIITHSDYDHYGGAEFLVDRFKIGQIVINDLSKNDSSLKRLKRKILMNAITVKPHYRGDVIKLGDGRITFYWPSVDFESNDDNGTSSIFDYQEGGFRLLFTGDSSPEILNRLTRQDVGGTDMLMVPHHGSRNGLTEKFLRLADPDIAVISVGKNNPFGHPHKSILDLIKAKKMKIMRTDEDGDIKFILGG